MRKRIIWVLAVVLAGWGTALCAGGDGVWVGTRFDAAQCLKIGYGSHTVKRKLCSIEYKVRPDGNRFAIDARLRFNDKYIPDTVSRVELEILLMDENRVCTKQLDRTARPDHGDFRFSFSAENLPNQRYVRTYYIIYYR